MLKRKKVTCFWSIFSILILYGDNQHSQKLRFYHLYLQLTLTLFYWKYSFRVPLWLSILFIFSMLQIIKFRCFEAIILQKNSFETKKHPFLSQIRMDNSFLPLFPLKMVLWTSKCHFWNAQKSDLNRILSARVKFFCNCW